MTSPQIRSGAAAATRPPLHDIAHLGHIELRTPKMCESLWFFVEVLVMSPDLDVRANRLALLRSMRDQFARVARVSEIQG